MLSTRLRSWTACFAAAALGFALLTGLPGCGTTAETPSDVGDIAYDDHGDPVGLHRHKRWSERIGQGAQPQGEEAFRNLAALGYTTVLSVDGARPDLESAAKFGLTYVHVPIGYDGVPEEAATKIVRAVQMAAGPVYVHCHHGKHRGPAGAMVARVAIDGIDNEQAVAELKASGCSPKYAGLYRDIDAYVAPSEEQLAALPERLPEFVEPDGLVDAMVRVSHTWENLKLVKAAAWGVPPSNPDVAPAHEATMLWEHLRETARLEESAAYGERFTGLLTTSEAAAGALQDALGKADAAAAEAAYATVAKSCSDCHTLFRN